MCFEFELTQLTIYFEFEARTPSGLIVAKRRYEREGRKVDVPSEGQVRAYLALLSAASLIQRAVDQNLREKSDLTQAKFEILAHLQQAGEGMRMTDLAQGLILSRSGATYQVQQLAEAGYVTREPDPADDRGIIVRLTRHGAAALGAALPGHYELVQHIMFDAISDSQVEQLATTLEAIVQRASQPVPAVAPSHTEQGNPPMEDRR